MCHVSCNACMKRFLQTIIGDSAQFTPSLRPTLGTKSRSYLQRSYTSHTDNGLRPLKNKSHQSSREESSSANGRFDRQSLSREEWLASRGVRPPTKVHVRKPNFESKFSMKKHLLYLQDPMKLAEFIRNTLRDDDFETAQDVVRAASKAMQCTVSWNHLVDWQLSQGRMNAAIKTYNEMKKRAQTPDAHTYTILFRGCAEHKDSYQAMTKVLAIYHSMLVDNAPVTPNTTHMNAVLKMCARAQNLDAMFSIAGQMPTHGIRAPNALTFTTIFNALRQNAAVDFRSDTLTVIQKRKLAENAILNARYIWRDVIKRWRKGDIWIDEELVCAMGRLLAVGKDRDRDDVLSLVEQAMNIPRQVPRKGSAARRLIEPSSQGRVQSDEDSSIVSTQDLPADAEGDEERGLTLVDQFESIQPSDAPKGVYAYAQPGQNTLSLVMLVLLELRLKESATKYWDILTKERGIRPDVDNYNAYLRNLRIARASTETVRILMQMPQSEMAVSTFRIAFATCIRDRNNPHAFANSGKILDLMQGALSQPDVKSMETYLEVAVTSPTYSSMISSSGHSDQSKYAQGAQITRALERLGPSFLNIKAFLAFNHTSKPHKRTEFVSSVLQLMQRMIGTYDMLMNKGMVPRERYNSLTKERSKLAAFITRHKYKKEITFPHENTNKSHDKSTQFLSQIDDPEIQGEMAEAKNSPETWKAFLSRMQASAVRKGAGAAEARAEEERRAAEAAARGVFAMEDESDDFTNSDVRIRY